MIFSVTARMQPAEKLELARPFKRKQLIKAHHLSSFGILNRNGLELTNGWELPAIEEENESRLPEFPDCSMPEQPSGYIKCRKHDFL